MKKISTNKLFLTHFLMFVFYFLTTKEIKAQTTVHLKFFIEGYYVASTGMMRPVRMNQGCPIPNAANEAVLATVSLHDNNPNYDVLESTIATLMTNGTCIATFAGTYAGSYYISVNHANTIETWSAVPIGPAQWSSSAPYDFTTNITNPSIDTQSSGPNQALVAPGVWAIYSGDVLRHGALDGFNYLDFHPYFIVFTMGCTKYDLDGDGNVGLSDWVIINNNTALGVTELEP